MMHFLRGERRRRKRKDLNKIKKYLTMCAVVRRSKVLSDGVTDEGRRRRRRKR